MGDTTIAPEPVTAAVEESNNADSAPVSTSLVEETQGPSPPETIEQVFLLLLLPVL